ncbi:MAG: choice-of-anchor L domain-containing protein [Bacteroidota bacterium]
MKKAIPIMLLIICCYGHTLTNNVVPPTVMGLTTNFAFTPEQLIKDHFIKGSCQNVENIESFGSELSIGYFDDGDSALGINSGIIISTGSIEDAVGPNESVGTTSAFNSTGGDPDLNLFATSSVFDATGIEFDFIPFTDQVTFNYVFASEEYCEFVGSIFNDNFGFFVSGPGINGDFFDDAINVATLPGSNEYVSINTVNYISNSASYVKNELKLDADECLIPFGANFLDLIEFDGFTIPLKATFNVIPCETYHIRLVVGDVGDDKLDSAVFLQSKSFDLGNEVNVKAKTVGSDETTAFENCRNGEFVFTRGNTDNLDQPLTVEFTVDPISDAVEGVDFEPLPTSITIPANQSSFVLPVNIIADQEVEMQERLRLQLAYECDCLSAELSDLFIEDVAELEGTFEEIYVCPDQEFTIGPDVVGGVSPYEFIWNTNATTQQLTETVDEPTHFTVTITDGCGATALAIAGVGIQDQPTATLSGDLEICEGDTAFLSIELEGNPPWEIAYSIDGVNQPVVENITNNPFTIPVYQSGVYELINFDDKFCEGIAEGTASVNSAGVQLDYATTPPSCPSVNDGSITLNLSDGTPPYSIIWENLMNDELNPTNLASGTYNISVTDANNCLVTAAIELATPERFDDTCLDDLIYIPNAFSPNDDGHNDKFTIHVGADDFVQSIVTVKIFNRWGAVVFEKNNILPDTNVELWDGFFKGKRMNTGIFVWMVELEFVNGQRQILSGDLSLLK